MNSEKKNILIIDDQIEIRELVGVTLRGTEFNVIKASGGIEGIKIARQLKPDVILLDIMMPAFDGFMTCNVLKRNLATKDIPVIFLTAKKTEEFISTALRAGAYDYIIKPFSPRDLKKRVKKAVESQKLKSARKTIKEKKEVIEEVDSSELQKLKSPEKFQISFDTHDDVISFPSKSENIVIDNYHSYHYTFEDLVSNGIINMVFDTIKINKIDGTGLALLIILNETLRSFGGDLRINYPSNKFNNRFSFIKITDLFRSFKNVMQAVTSFHDLDTDIEEISDFTDLNVCLFCTYVNASDSQYCIFCGANLNIGKEEKILEIIRHSILRTIMSDAHSNDIQDINKSRNIEAEETEFPSDFFVELLTDNLTIRYKSILIDSKDFKKNEQIAIQAPFFKGEMLQVQPGMKLQLKNAQTGIHSIFETEIIDVDEENRMIFVHYTEEAKVSHSQKNYSVALKLPISVKFVVPNFQHAGEIYKAKILELSRLRMIVFSEEVLPLNQCMAIKFNLPDGQEISSPLVIARKGKQMFMFDIEFKVIDEKESSMITQYMYKRQIELAKGLMT